MKITRAQKIRDFMTAIEVVIRGEPRVGFTDAEVAEKISAITGQQVKANRIYYYRKELGIPAYNKRRRAYDNGEEKTA